jgi:hypothetical protein
MIWSISFSSIDSVNFRENHVIFVILELSYSRIANDSLNLIRRTRQVALWQMLFIKNIKLKNSSQKFFHKFIKLFRIVKTMNKQIYRLIFFSFYRIHDVFYIFYLKSYKRREYDNIISEYSSFELLDDDEINEIKKILQKKIIKIIIYYLIKWKDWSEKYNEWMTKKNMNALDLL